jgi:thioredoxin-related protein
MHGNLSVDVAKKTAASPSLVWRSGSGVLLVLLIVIPSRAQQVKWRLDYNTARQEAVEKGLPLLLNVGTENCSWCKKLDIMTLQDTTIVRLLHEQFIPVKVDANQNASLTEALRIQSYPTLILAGPDGKILSTSEGFLDADRLKDLLQKSLVGLKTPEPIANDNDRGQMRMLLTADPEIKLDQRSRRARELLAQAKNDFETRQFLACLDRCETLTTTFADLPECGEAGRLFREIKSNPEWMRQACENLSDRLATLYLAMAETCLKKGQPQQAVFCLERIIQALPGTRQADTALTRLSQLNGQPMRSTNFRQP